MRRNRITVSRRLGTSFGDRKPCPPDHEQKDGKKAQMVGEATHSTRQTLSERCASEQPGVGPLEGLWACPGCTQWGRRETGHWRVSAGLGSACWVGALLLPPLGLLPSCLVSAGSTPAIHMHRRRVSSWGSLPQPCSSCPGTASLFMDLLTKVSFNRLLSFGGPLLYLCLRNPRDRGGWQATVHSVAKESDKTE